MVAAIFAKEAPALICWVSSLAEAFNIGIGAFLVSSNQAFAPFADFTSIEFEEFHVVAFT
jgi:hypothetical protein